MKLNINSFISEAQKQISSKNYFLAKDLRAFRQYYREVVPDVDMKTSILVDGDVVEGVEVGIGVGFFWPDAGI